MKPVVRHAMQPVSQVAPSGAHEGTRFDSGTAPPR